MPQVLDIIEDGKEFRLGYGRIHIGPKLRTQAAAEIVRDWFIGAMPDLANDLTSVKERADFIEKLITTGQDEIDEEFANVDCADPTNPECKCRGCLRVLEEPNGP